MASYQKTIEADSANCGTLISRNASYNTAAAGLGTMEVRFNGQWYWAGQTWNTDQKVYEVFGFYLVFDTSEIPNNAVITAAAINIRINKTTIVTAGGFPGPLLRSWFKIHNWTEPLDASDWVPIISCNTEVCAYTDYTISGDIDQWVTLSFPSATLTSINKGTGARTGVVSGYQVADLVFGGQDTPNYMRYAHQNYDGIFVEAKLIVDYTITETDISTLVVDMVPEGIMGILLQFTAPTEIRASCTPEGLFLITSSTTSTIVNMYPDMYPQGTLHASPEGIRSLEDGTTMLTHGYIISDPEPWGPADYDLVGTLYCCVSGLLFLDSGANYDYISIGLSGYGEMLIGELAADTPLGALTLSGVGTISFTASIDGYEVISASMLLEVDATGGFPV